MSNLIDDFVNEFVEDYDCPPIYIEAAAYWVASSTLGLFAEIAGLKRLFRKPNIYVIFSSIPWATRRSTVVGLARRAYIKAWEYHLEDIKTNPEEIRDIIENSIFRESTPQGLADAIDETNLDHYSIIAPEMGAMWSRMGEKNLAGAKQLLSQLYDGSGFREDLSRKSRKSDEASRRAIPEGLFFTMIGDLQEPQHYFDKIDLGQGILRRTLLIYQKSESIDPEKTKSEYVWEEYEAPEDKVARIARKFADRMLELREGVKVYMSLDGEADILEREKEIRRIIRDAGDHSYTELWRPVEVDMLKKLPVLRIIASDREMIMPDRHLLIHNEYGEAKQFIERALVNMPEATQKIFVRSKTPTYTDEEFMKQKVINKIIAKDNWCSNLTNTLGTSLKEITPILETLISEQRIFGLKLVASSRGRPSTFFTTDYDLLKSKCEEYEKEGKICHIIERGDLFNI